MVALLRRLLSVSLPSSRWPTRSIMTLAARDANCKVHAVSGISFMKRVTCAITRALAFVLKHFFSMRVSKLSRYGTNLSWRRNAMTTLPRAVKLWLIYFASSTRSLPGMDTDVCRSLPAKSTKYLKRNFQTIVNETCYIYKNCEFGWDLCRFGQIFELSLHNFFFNSVPLLCLLVEMSTRRNIKIMCDRLDVRFFSLDPTRRLEIFVRNLVRNCLNFDWEFRLIKFQKNVVLQLPENLNLKMKILFVNFVFNRSKVSFNDERDCHCQQLSRSRWSLWSCKPVRRSWGDSR